MKPFETAENVCFESERTAYKNVQSYVVHMFDRPLLKTETQRSTLKFELKERASPPRLRLQECPHCLYFRSSGACRQCEKFRPVYLSVHMSFSNVSFLIVNFVLVVLS